MDVRRDFLEIAAIFITTKYEIDAALQYGTRFNAKPRR